MKNLQLITVTLLVTQIPTNILLPMLITMVLTMVLITLLSSILLLDRNLDKTKHNLTIFWEQIEPDWIQNFTYYPNYNFELANNAITNTFTNSMLNYSLGNYQTDQENFDKDIETENKETGFTYYPKETENKETGFTYYPKVALTPTKLIEVNTDVKRFHKTKKEYQKPILLTNYQETFDKDIDMLETELQETFDKDIDMLETELNLNEIICIDKKGVTNPIAKKHCVPRNNISFNKLDKVLKECKKPANFNFKFSHICELAFYDVIKDKSINLAFNLSYDSSSNTYDIKAYNTYKIIPFEAVRPGSTNNQIIPQSIENLGGIIDLDIKEFENLIYKNDIQMISEKPTNKIITLDYKSFQLSLKQGSKFISKDFTKAKLCKLLLNNGLVVSTDSFQLYKHQLFTSEITHKFLLTIDQIKELTSFKLSEVKEVTISINDDIVKFEIGNNTFTYELQSDYIAYDSITYDLDNYDTILTIDNKVIQDTLKALKPSLSKDTPVIKIVVENGKVNIHCSNDSSRANLPLECLKVQGIPVTIGLGDRYLLEIVKTIKAHKGNIFKMYIKGSDNVVVLQHDNLDCIVMPMDVD